MSLPDKRDKHGEPKKKKRRAKKTDDTVSGYNNSSNPFGDANLREKFVWRLKIDKMKKAGVDPAKLSKKSQKSKREELKRELEKVKKRREEREQEKLLWEEERQRQSREQDMSAYADWEAKEDQFHLQQALVRSETRIRQGRPKPIDALYMNLSLHPDFEFNMNEPHTMFEGLPLHELRDLRNDIIVFVSLDEHKDFWQALLVVCDDEIAKASATASSVPPQRQISAETATATPLPPVRNDGALHSAIAEDVEAIFKGKTSAQLEEMQAEITKRTEGRNAVDVEYWEALSARLKVFKAKAVLREIHAGLLKRYLEQLENKKEELKRTMAAAAERDSNEPASTDDPEGSGSQEDNNEAQQAGTWEGAGSLSPELIKDSEDIPPTAEIVDPEKDMEQLAKQRQQVLKQEAEKLILQSSSAAVPPPTTATTTTTTTTTSSAGRLITDRLLTEEEMFAEEASRTMEENEENFTATVDLSSQVYWWHDKFRPRKPRFFNRVHTGYEWNKYNQSHYDHDNPPPKIVQGYKFNIFFPDLIDKRKTPEFFKEPDIENNPDFCILRIHSGPPYEDIAFRIVNREWEYSHKHGFKCVFDRGILHLWFNFKRYRYRR
ncbi:Cactin protein [Pelomyxa schiedti]|nr:Cactin protein [Pelomyxa schiedti]